MCNGRLTAILDNKDATQTNIMEYATKFSEDLTAVN
jgi:delta-aminolevulinic acid dehydratase/porphobilinogen synthase